MRPWSFLLPMGHKKICLFEQWALLNGTHKLSGSRLTTLRVELRSKDFRAICSHLNDSGQRDSDKSGKRERLGKERKSHQSQEAEEVTRLPFCFSCTRMPCAAHTASPLVFSARCVFKLLEYVIKGELTAILLQKQHFYRFFPFLPFPIQI